MLKSNVLKTFLCGHTFVSEVWNWVTCSKCKSVDLIFYCFQRMSSHSPYLVLTMKRLRHSAHLLKNLHVWRTLTFPEIVWIHWRLVIKWLCEWDFCLQMWIRVLSHFSIVSWNLELQLQDTNCYLSSVTTRVCLYRDWKAAHFLKMLTYTTIISTQWRICLRYVSTLILPIWTWG